jgi:cytoskeletal protein CcmA (bactofilin family)
MWERKEEAGPSAGVHPEQGAAASQETTLAHTSRPVATARPARAERAQQPSTHIGKGLKIKGEISGGEDAYIDGEVEGTIDLSQNCLTIGPNGDVRAHVKIRSVTVLGRLKGSVTAAEKIEIRKTGSFEGDLVTPRIVIEDGAVVSGNIDIVKPNVAQSSPATSNGKGAKHRPSAQSLGAAAEAGPDSELGGPKTAKR